MKYFLPIPMEEGPRGANPVDYKEVMKTDTHRCFGFLILNSSPKYQDHGGRTPAASCLETRRCEVEENGQGKVVQ